MSFKELLNKAKAKAEGFAAQHNINIPSSSNSPTQYPPVPPNRPSGFNNPQQPASSNGPYWSPTFSSSTPVSANFKHQLGAHGWGNNELQNYVAEPANSFHDPQNNLIIRAIAHNGSYTSARLTSHVTLTKHRGSLIAVATPPCAEGIWPALWLLPKEPFTWPNEGEVDILETWNADDINHTCLHWGHFNGEDWNKHRAIETPMPDMRGRAHTYEFAWDQPEHGKGGKMVWYIDGKLVMKAAIAPGFRPIHDWQIIINVAMGGNVCAGKIPQNGHYDFAVHSLQLSDEPTVGWGRFGTDWQYGPEGHAM